MLLLLKMMGDGTLLRQKLAPVPIKILPVPIKNLTVGLILLCCNNNG